MRKHRGRLDTSVGAPGPHDFAVREIRRSSHADLTSTASRRNVRDVRNAPLIGRDARIKLTDLPVGLICRGRGMRIWLAGEAKQLAARARPRMSGGGRDTHQGGDNLARPSEPPQWYRSHVGSLART